MTWVSVAFLAVGVWGQRLVGMFVGARVVGRIPALARLAVLIPAAVVMAVIVQLTVGDGRSLSVDERLAGMAVASVLVWRRASFVAVVCAAAVTTALVRSIGA